MSTSDYTDTQPTPQDAQQAILSPITKALTDNNITLDRLSNKISDLIDCKRPVGVDKEGNTVDTNDNPSQIKAVDMALKLQQAYPAERQELQVSGVQIMAPEIKKPKNAGRKSNTGGGHQVGYAKKMVLRLN